MALNLDTISRVHFVGVKGAGMTALAQLFASKGLHVTGSDTNETFFTDAVLKRLGMEVTLFDAANITNEIDAVVYSMAYNVTNPEMAQAIELGIPLISYAEALAHLFNASHGIAVCGSHGKTTTTALLGVVLAQINADPTVVVGSQVNQFQSNARVGTSNLMVIEADEYGDKLSYYQPADCILTSVDYDHPDFFKTLESYHEVFTRFAQKITEGKIIACWENAGVRASLASVDSSHILSYGWDSSYNFWTSDYRVNEEGTHFKAHRGDELLGAFTIPLMGRHNVLNALSVIAMICHLDLFNYEAVSMAISEFRGTTRRFEEKGSVGNVLIIDDYGHHPTEVEVTLQAARERFLNKRIWCVFGPHTFSRTEALMQEFAQAFKQVEKVIIVPIYSSAREKAGSVSSQHLVDAVNAVSHNALYVSSNDEALKYLREHLDEIDILITMGAGDVYMIGDELLQQ